jgi:hypothetical protein
MPAAARTTGAVAVSAALLLAAGCGGSSHDGSDGSDASGDSSAASPSASASPSSGPTAEPTALPFDRSVLSTRQPTSMRQAVRLVNSAADRTVVSVQPLRLQKATPDGLVGLDAKSRATTTGKDVYFLTYRVSYVNGKVESLAPYVPLLVLGADGGPFTQVDPARPGPKGCQAALTAGKTFGAGSSYTECSIQASAPVDKPNVLAYSDYQMPQVRPEWPAR